MKRKARLKTGRVDMLKMVATCRPARVVAHLCESAKAPCNIGNPPAERSPSYDEVPHPDGARLLNDEERQRAMDGRWKGRTREGGAPIPADGVVYSLLNTFDNQNDLISFACKSSGLAQPSRHAVV